MSIYATQATLYIERDDDVPVRVYVQVVPSWVDFECSYLPPPRTDVSETDGYLRPRAVFFITDDTRKGEPGRGGQEYTDPLLIMSGEEYERATFRDVIDRLYRAVNGIS